jgi:hypothetical protein
VTICICWWAMDLDQTNACRGGEGGGVRRKRVREGEGGERYLHMETG